MKQFVFLSWFLFTVQAAISQLQPIGFWREHLPYHSSISVAAGNNKIFSATPYSVFSVDVIDGSIQRLSRMTGLSETGVSAISYTSSGNLVIAYSNSNVDIVKDDIVRNIDAIKQSTVSGDKSIYRIFPYNNKVYLCTGIGIIVIDETKYEVSDTYIIGSSGQKIRVMDLTVDGNFFYAATDEGLKRAAINSSNLSDYRNWQSLSAVPVQSVHASGNGSVFVERNDSLFVYQTSLNFIYADGFQFRNISYSGGQLYIAEGTRIVVLNAGGSVAQIFQNAILKSANHAIRSGDIWVADSTSGLIRISGNSFTPYIPNSPAANADGDLVVYNDLLFASGRQKKGVYKYSDGTWTNYNATNRPALDSLPDIVALAIDPRDQSVWGGSFGGGFFNLKQNGNISIFKQNYPANVNGLAFDSQNNLWITDYGASQNLFVLRADGTTQRFTIPFVHFQNAVSQIVIDDLDQKWIVSPNGNGLFVFDGGKWRYFRSGAGNGNLPANNVLSIAKDKNGFIWVGTSSGIGIIHCAAEAFNNGCDAILPVIQQGNFNGFLFREEQVQAIAVDGANRKWVGTRNGAWLISPDGEKVIQHFTEENSMLLSNDVRKIAINGTTGEVFFSTSKGICSYKGTATDGGTANINVVVFPNPVPPSYNGTIGIRGLVNNASVKITELDGRLVYETRALGGQAVWNGRDYKGRKISSGVYVVLVRDESGKEKMATKIVFIK